MISHSVIPSLVLLCVATLAGCRTRFVDGLPESSAPADLPSSIEASNPADLSPFIEASAPLDLSPSSACPNLLVLEESGQLSSFDTRTLRFTDRATLACRPHTGTAVALAVARDSTAWVFYSDDELFEVDTATGACRPTAF